MKRLTKQEINDCKVVEDYLNQFNADLWKQIIAMAKASKANYITFSNCLSSARLICSDKKAGEAYFKLPFKGDQYYDSETLRVTELDFFINDPHIVDILVKASDEMLNRILFLAMDGMRLYAYHQGLHFISLDLQEDFSKQCLIVK